MFLLIRAINRVENQFEAELADPAEAEATHKKWPYYISTILRKATRCPQGTSELMPVTQAVVA